VGAKGSWTYGVYAATLPLPPRAAEMRVLDMWLRTLTCRQYPKVIADKSMATITGVLFNPTGFEYWDLAAY